jgi:hypothetical protein
MAPRNPGPSASFNREFNRANTTARNAQNRAEGRTPSSPRRRRRGFGSANRKSWYRRAQQGYEDRKATEETAAAQEASVLEALMQAAFGGGAEEPLYLGAPSRDTYLQPFVEAEKRANDAYTKTVPELQSIYADLRSRMKATDADLQSATAMYRNEREGDIGRALAEAGAPQAEQAALVAGGETATGQEQAQAANLDNLRATYDAERARANRFQQIDAASAADHMRNADTSEAAAGANARNTLDKVLAQIGIGKADAEQQFNRDSQEISRANEQMRRQSEAAKRDLAMQQLNAYLALEKSRADRAVTSGRKQFDAMIPDLSAKYPRQWQIFNDIIAETKGKGQQGRANALAILEEVRGGLEDGSLYGVKVTPERLRSWIDAYYDEEEGVDEGLFEQLGGDPRTLSFLDSEDPTMALLLMQLGLGG